MARYKKDIILIIALLIIGAVLAAVILLMSGKGSTVVVRQNGEVTARYPLNKDRVEEIVSADGGTNLLVIEDGAAYVDSASCPDGLCIGMGRITRSGQSIVCLPNKLVITIDDGDTSDDIIYSIYPFGHFYQKTH